MRNFFRAFWHELTQTHPWETVEEHTDKYGFKNKIQRCKTCPMRKYSFRG